MVILGIGSNLSSVYGNRFENINLAIFHLEQYGFKVIKKSAFYETPSYPNKSNPKFINIVIQVSTSLPAIDLASVLLFIEEKLERKRNVKNDPRTCDIDIIDFNGKVLDFKYNNLNFTVPHKKLIFRNFVLFPLLEIIPDWKHPETNQSVNLLVQNLSSNDKNSILKVEKS
ncbi:2-amino-4-hydroxy-6-hydroxymethyldihydropteridine diphosphokinase [Pelagibacteraceae bacterium]|jgi:2-amino-4-hydroxy-6-hydroxymethyldihydropteridine diphosphokinase|nr:2-amino-4-hydroxy-6-hydroxymethyldihydropteridine diphosphokinase [Pelagibacteraceae bacterium]